MTRIKSGTPFFAILAFLLLAVSCQDDSVSGPDMSEVPNFPGFAYAFMAVDIFQNNDTNKITAQVSNRVESELANTISSHPDQVRMNPTIDKLLFDGVFHSVQNRETDSASPRSSQNIAMSDDEDVPTHFEMAKELVREVQFSLQSVQSIYYNLLSAASQHQVSEDGDQYIWEYQMSLQDDDGSHIIDFLLTTEAVGDNNYLWNLYATGLDLGETSKELHIMEAVSSFDGQSGNVSVSIPELTIGEVFQSVITWDVDQSSFVTMTLDFEFDGEENDRIETVATYALDSTNQMASITDGYAFQDNERDDEFSVTWSLDNNSGTLFLNGDELCWEESFENTSCE